MSRIEAAAFARSDSTSQPSLSCLPARTALHDALSSVTTALSSVCDVHRCVATVIAHADADLQAHAAAATSPLSTLLHTLHCHRALLPTAAVLQPFAPTSQGSLPPSSPSLSSLPAGAASLDGTPSHQRHTAARTTAVPPSDLLLVSLGQQLAAVDALTRGAASSLATLQVAVVAVVQCAVGVSEDDSEAEAAASALSSALSTAVCRLSDAAAHGAAALQQRLLASTLPALDRTRTRRGDGSADRVSDALCQVCPTVVLSAVCVLLCRGCCSYSGERLSLATCHQVAPALVTIDS